MENLVDFYKHKNVFITGHTGFKGSWLAFILSKFGANVVGYALEPPTSPNLFQIADIGSMIDSRIGDIRDFAALQDAIRESKPDVVFHLAAQPLVIDGYSQPRYTYETNVMGTVNLLDALRDAKEVRSVLNVTTDKVYLNKELAGYGYVEDDPLDGYDPYSNSKSCSELVTHSYAKSFFDPMGIPVSTARAGNVIGGGDFASNRIIPDCFRAAESGSTLLIRNPNSTRPYQHVLEPLFAYLAIAILQTSDPSISSSYNVGPDDADCVTTEQLVRMFADAWGNGFSWGYAVQEENACHEANFLKLNSSKLKEKIGWKPRWHSRKAIEVTVDWYKCFFSNGSVVQLMDRQIEEYMS